MSRLNTLTISAGLRMEMFLRTIVQMYLARRTRWAHNRAVSLLEYAILGAFVALIAGLIYKAFKPTIDALLTKVTGIGIGS